MRWMQPLLSPRRWNPTTDQEQTTDMKTLVIGGTGVVGPGLVSALVRHGHDVTVLHRGVTEGPLPDVARRIHCDVSTPDLVAMVRAGGYDAIVDLCCYDEDDAARTVAVGEGIDRVMVVSSVNAHGGPISKPLHEDAPLRPVSDYGRGKAGAERVLERAKERGTLSPTVVRLGACYRVGSHLDGQLYEDCYWLGCMLRAEATVVADGGKAVWNVIHADDAGEAMCALLVNDAAIGQTVLVGSAQRFTWWDYYAAIADGLGSALVPLDLPSAWIQAQWGHGGFLEEMSSHDQIYELSRLHALAPGYVESRDWASGVVQAARDLRDRGELGDEDLVAELHTLVARWRETVA
jgi:nucleoside-diphosphate-sugar epimerase